MSSLNGAVGRRIKMTGISPILYSSSSCVFLLPKATRHDWASCSVTSKFFEELGRYPVISEFIQTLSPLSLGFDLQSGAGRAIPFQELLLNGGAMDSGIFQHYPQLMQLQTNWAPFIARLAYHAADVFDAKNIPLLREMSAITSLLLPSSLCPASKAISL